MLKETVLELYNQIKTSFIYVKLDFDIEQFDEEFFAQKNFEVLSKYNEQLISIDNKKKSKDFVFLNKIKLFLNETVEIDFELFRNENKNTKKTLIKYLSKIYLICFVLKNGENTDSQEFKKLFNNISSPDFIKDLPKPVYDMSMEIVNSLKSDIDNKKINPSDLLSDLLSGKKNSTLEGLMSNIQNTLDEKIENGDIDTNEIDKFIKNIF